MTLQTLLLVGIGVVAGFAVGVIVTAIFANGLNEVNVEREVNRGSWGH
jgi:hypothetical protein